MRPCMVCGDITEDGVTVLHAFLCDACQRDIVDIEVGDARYEFYVQRMAALWRSLAQAALD